MKMKIIVTGATGFIGAEVLRQALSHPAITSVIALSRRELTLQDPKLEVIVVEDFLRWTEAVKERLGDADGCVWALGRAQFPNLTEARKVSIDYTMAGVEAMLSARHAAPSSNKRSQKPFHFIYLSGVIVEPDQDRKLWFLAEGEVENLLPALVKQRPGELDVSITKPAYVLDSARPWVAVVLSSVLGGFSVRKDELAAAMLGRVLDGGEGGEGAVLDNAALGALGRRVLEGV